jgi:hypothetical protein
VRYPPRPCVIFSHIWVVSASLQAARLQLLLQWPYGLHTTAEGNHVDTMEMLIEAGAELHVDQRMEGGKQALNIQQLVSTTGTNLRSHSITGSIITTGA